ncbi:MAG: polysaccharide biosynthesis tyrosine autokinase [Candidatus Onthomonas sp.]|nr:polysaccharide biosynthesis tyrosine autokinase [Candidatus Onthomonas sp.]
MESNRNSDAAPYEQIDLFKIFDHIRLGIRRLFWLAPILIAVFAAAGYFYAKHTYVPSYTAYASFVVSADTPYGGSQSYYNRTTASQLSKTFPYIISSGVLKQVVAEDLGVTSIPATISAESTLESALFTLKATSNDPQSAYNVLQSVIENYPKVAEYIIGSTQLTKLDESGVPTEPSNPPDFWSYAGIGAAAGAVLTLLIMYVYSLTRKTVRSEDDLKEQISVTSLGALPFAPLKRRRKSNDRSLLLTRNIVDEMIGDPMRMIRTRLVVELEREEIRSFMVTSSLPGEGKTTTAANLALSLAQKGYSVILVDGDLRNPSVAKLFGIESAFGLADLLEGKCGLEQTLYTVKDTSLRVLTGLPNQLNPTTLISSSGMHDLLETLNGMADYVIVDTPPCRMMSDATLYARHLQGAVMVVRQDYARVSQVIACFESLAETGISILGYIRNAVTEESVGYGRGYSYGSRGYQRYGYGYGYGSKKK